MILLCWFFNLETNNVPIISVSSIDIKNMIWSEKVGWTSLLYLYMTNVVEETNFLIRYRFILKSKI